MNHPWTPLYLGTYDDLLRILLHNPFWGDGRDPRVPLSHQTSNLDPASLMAEPDPLPWRVAISHLMTAISLKALVAGKPEGASIAGHAERTISAFLDEYCGTPPGKIPVPWPGPHPWAMQLSAQLVMVANSFEAGKLRDETLLVAERIVQRSITTG